MKYVTVTNWFYFLHTFTVFGRFWCLTIVIPQREHCYCSMFSPCQTKLIIQLCNRVHRLLIWLFSSLYGQKTLKTWLEFIGKRRRNGWSGYWYRINDLYRELKESIECLKRLVTEGLARVIAILARGKYGIPSTYYCETCQISIWPFPSCLKITAPRNNSRI